jgi:hypothetical protein
MANPLKQRREEPVGMTGAPQELTEYVGWFNQRFRFAKAEIKVGPDGKRFMDLKWK